tara:strand:+ start:161 stop:280 length:120 start_codon:yes stop_codon:yes gene_type:complete
MYWVKNKIKNLWDKLNTQAKGFAIGVGIILVIVIIANIF